MIEKNPLNEKLKAILRDDGAYYVGTPKWDRASDPELFDAIITIRDYYIRTAYPHELPFNVGSSYVRKLNSLFSEEYPIDKIRFNEAELQAWKVIDGRL